MIEYNSHRDSQPKKLLVEVGGFHELELLDFKAVCFLILDNYKLESVKKLTGVFISPEREIFQSILNSCLSKGSLQTCFELRTIVDDIMKTNYYDSMIDEV